MLIRDGDERMRHVEDRGDDFCCLSCDCCRLRYRKRIHLMGKNIRKELVKCRPKWGTYEDRRMRHVDGRGHAFCGLSCDFCRYICGNGIDLMRECISSKLVNCIRK